ncbi:MAG: hypothetical protein KA184_14210 [Candidatus Hydrogenedentes bacterium]|nr:hypothetical protein [Candidatus Hydrogenedentota bacterium]
MTWAAALAFLLGQPANLLPETLTPESFAQWAVWPECARVELAETEAGAAVRISVGADQDVSWRQAIRRFPVKPGQRFQASVRVLGADLRDGAGAGLSIGFYDQEDQRISHAEEYCNREVLPWSPVVVRGEAPPGACVMRYVLVLHGRGDAYFHAPRLLDLGTASAPPEDGMVTVRATDEVVCDSLLGFGFEDDGWFYSMQNAERGVDDAAVALREKRVAWLEPDWVRMFFWYHDWNPNLDAAEFTWESDNMRSHYRSLDLYQRIDARVTICGVEWGMPQVFADPHRLSQAIGELLEHLIVAKGYTCVRDWTLTNEPNLFYAPKGNTFDRYREIHRLVRAECERRGLSVNIAGSDDGRGAPWFQHCVRDDDYFALADLFASHFYLSPPEVPFAERIFRDRVELLRARTPVKPFVVAEFGLQDWRTEPPDKNPLMREYSCAMHTAACFIDGLNAGAAGFSVWCLQEMYYPGAESPMRFGLWDFGGDWAVRPVYHAVACFTRHAKAGDVVRRCVSSYPDGFKAVRVGDTVFWANTSERSLEARIEDFPAAYARAWTENDVGGESESGTETLLEQGACAVPPRSFGLIAAQKP